MDRLSANSSGNVPELFLKTFKIDRLLSVRSQMSLNAMNQI